MITESKYQNSTWLNTGLLALHACQTPNKLTKFHFVTKNDNAEHSTHIHICRTALLLLEWLALQRGWIERKRNETKQDLFFCTKLDLASNCIFVCWCRCRCWCVCCLRSYQNLLFFRTCVYFCCHTRVFPLPSISRCCCGIHASLSMLSVYFIIAVAAVVVISFLFTRSHLVII